MDLKCWIFNLWFTHRGSWFKKKYADKDFICPWRIVLDFVLSQVGREFILKCNFDIRKLSVYLPVVYKECLKACTLLNDQSSFYSYRDVFHQVIWNNKFINVQKVSLYEENLSLKGIVTVGDLLSDTGSFLKGPKVLNANLSPVEHFKLMSIIVTNTVHCCDCVTVNTSLFCDIPISYRHYLSFDTRVSYKRM